MAAVFKQTCLLRAIFRNNFLYQSSKQMIHRNNVRYCKKKSPDPSESVPAGVLGKYEPFRDNRAPVIMDIEEERRKVDMEEEAEEFNEFQGISPNRGIHGVIDVEELVDILKKENGLDVFVVSVPAEYRYVQYMVIVSGRSNKHMLGMAEFVRKVYKYKRNNKDIIPMLEGKGSRDWIALDLGNIALHIFSKTKREYYDLESLWAIGSELDTICNEPEDPIIQILKQHAVGIDDDSKNMHQ